MSYSFYKVLHLVGILFLFLSLGAMAAAGGSAERGRRALAAATHGAALLVVLVAGFGLLARLGMFGDIPGWAWAKMGVWLLMGLAVVPLRKRPEWAPALWFVLPALGGLAAWLAVAKPF